MIKSAVEICEELTKRGVLAPDSLWLEVAPEVVEQMSEDWSQPLEARIEDGELLFRIPEADRATR